MDEIFQNHVEKKCCVFFFKNKISICVSACAHFYNFTYKQPTKCYLSNNF